MKNKIQNKDLFQKIFEASGEGIIAVDEDGDILASNPACEQLFGYNPGELNDQNIDIIIPEKFRHLYKNYIKKRGPGLKRERHLWGIKKDGSTFYLNLRISPSVIDGKNVTIAFFWDATQEKEYAQELEQKVQERTQEVMETVQKLSESNIRLEDQIRITNLAEGEAVTSKNIASEIAKNFPNGFVAVMDEQSKIVFADGDALEQLGLKQFYQEGRSIDDISVFSEERKAKIKESIKKTLSGKHLSFEVSYKDKYFAVNTAPLTDKNNKISSSLHVYNDISKQKEIEFTIQNALKSEQELNDMKSRFVSLASHEFRTPLSAILTSAILIGKQNGDGKADKREKYLARIERNVNNLTIILNDFLSLSKMDEGKVMPINERVDLISYSKKLVKDTNITLKKNQTIMVTSANEELFVHLDRKLLNHILNNLLSNASKYSSEGATIDFKITEKNKTILLEISDHGIGIPQEEQKYIFGRFFRAKNAFNIEGTGLGLSIAKHYTELMGGTITFKSEPKHGTTFSVELPIQK
ncbi:sensor histidine kinase [Gelidibacter sp.]|uniref:sensor histidine kinase n=1 Tax=Gelidibacter sp. TaxID=2018083 RepID=UPI002BA7E036|nr:ATP-binding protein [Gelidibacter sp.]HUH26608.1 ATP-binding protein [Gelidibacter sp.]